MTQSSAVSLQMLEEFHVLDLTEKETSCFHLLARSKAWIHHASCELSVSFTGTSCADVYAFCSIRSFVHGVFLVVIKLFRSDDIGQLWSADFNCRPCICFRYVFSKACSIEFFSSEALASCVVSSFHNSAEVEPCMRAESVPPETQASD